MNNIKIIMSFFFLVTSVSSVHAKPHITVEMLKKAEASRLQDTIEACKQQEAAEQHDELNIHKKFNSMCECIKKNTNYPLNNNLPADKSCCTQTEPALKPENLPETKELKLQENCDH